MLAKRDPTLYGGLGLGELETRIYAWARELGRNDFAEILTANLQEEMAADAKLSAIAGRRVSPMAQGRKPARRTMAARRKQPRRKAA